VDHSHHDINYKREHGLEVGVKQWRRRLKQLGYFLMLLPVVSRGKSLQGEISGQ
jgi:hypothetical protein